MKQGYYFVQQSGDYALPWRAGICLPSGDELIWDSVFQTPEGAREHCRMSGRRRFKGTDDWAIVTRERRAKEGGAMSGAAQEVAWFGNGDGNGTVEWEEDCVTVSDGFGNEVTLVGDAAVRLAKLLLSQEAGK